MLGAELSESTTVIVSGFRSTARGRMTLLGAGTLLALLVAAAVAPGSARAACGDHAQFRPPGGAEPAQPPAKPGIPASPAIPCHGPNCSGGDPTTPPMPLPSPAPTGEERWGEPLLPEAAPAAGLAERLTCSPSRRPIRRAAAVFHPPRLS